MGAVVLAGGASRRMGGRDKLSLRVDGRVLLDRVLDAVSDVDHVVAVGPPRATEVAVRWVREDPPGSGPLAGLAAGLAAVPESVDLVAVLAGDHPHVTPGTISRLVAAVRSAPRAAGAVLADSSGAPQWLVGVWRAGIVRRNMPAQVSDRPLRALFTPLDPVLVPAHGAEASDVDRPEDVPE